MVDRYNERNGHKSIALVENIPINPFGYARRTTNEVANFGGTNVPRVIADLTLLKPDNYKDLKAIGHFYLPEPDKWKMNDLGADYVYSGTSPINFMLPNGLKEMLDYTTWTAHKADLNKLPLYTKSAFMNSTDFHPEVNFVQIEIGDIDTDLIEKLKDNHTVVLVLITDNAHGMAEQRRAIFELIDAKLSTPIVLKRSYGSITDDQLQIYAATDIGGLLIDGLGDGAMLGMDKLEDNLPKEELLEVVDSYNKTTFGILQAARTRMTKTEYISCPSCGRTLFDLQETTAMIRKRTDHLKGVKIGIMGCIVNGPGEMADADYGYVGSGKGKITLYKGQEVMKRAVPSENAVDELIDIIKEDGRWIELEDNL